MISPRQHARDPVLAFVQYKHTQKTIITSYSAEGVLKMPVSSPPSHIKRVMSSLRTENTF